MPTPTRPTTGGPVESSWGQEVHDQAFAPSAVVMGGGGASATGARMFLGTTIADPGGWRLASPDTLTVPADGGGVYLCVALATVTVGVVFEGQATAQLAMGSQVPVGYTWFSNTTGIGRIAIPMVHLLAPGEQVYVVGQTPGGVTFNLSWLALVRLGRAYGVA